MTLRIRTLSGLGELHGLSPSALKAVLNVLEAATGQTGRYNAGPASNNSLSGTAGFYVFRATYHLAIDAADCAGELTSMAANLANLLSSKVGAALSAVDSVTRNTVGVIGKSLHLLDKGALGVTLGEILWLADQGLGGGYLQEFLEDAATTISGVAEAYLAVLERGACGGTATPPKFTDRLIQNRISIDNSPIIGLDPRDTVTQIVPNFGVPTPAPKKAISPAVVVGGAAVAAAVLLLAK